MNEGPCVPNTTQNCGTAGGSQSCGSDCNWGTCSCVGPTSQTCNCTGTQTRSCNNGNWSGWSACSGGTNTGSDPQNCGSCGHSCTSGICNGGTCGCGTCSACQKCDTTSGSCVAATGVPCTVANGGGACDAQGNCTARSCNPSYVLCSGTCILEGDHVCGPSCSDCYLPPNTTTPHIDIAACLNHACKILQCNSEGPFCSGCGKVADWGDCNNDWKDGCEIDVTTDANNCSACGGSCSLCQPGDSTNPNPARFQCEHCEPPCTACRKHPHSGGPGIWCDPS
jgi:hypothetical protein